MEIIKREFGWDCVPRGYMLCFNATCPKCEQCLRYISGLYVPATKTHGTCVYPTALQNGECRYYKQIRVIQAAQGFDDLFSDVRRSDYASMQAELKGYLGTGGTFSRYKLGLRILTPEQQEWIRNLFRRYGYSDDVKFTHMFTTYDFSE